MRESTKAFLGFQLFYLVLGAVIFILRGNIKLDLAVWISAPLITFLVYRLTDYLYIKPKIRDIETAIKHYNEERERLHCTCQNSIEPNTFNRAIDSMVEALEEVTSDKEIPELHVPAMKDLADLCEEYISEVKYGKEG